MQQTGRMADSQTTTHDRLRHAFIRKYRPRLFAYQLPMAYNRGQSGGSLNVLGPLGIHKFILGLTTPAVIMLLVSLLTCAIGALVMQVIGLVEGIIYLTKTDEEFYQTYMVEKKGWF
jgi:hypothetical protein